MKQNEQPDDMQELFNKFDEVSGYVSGMILCHGKGLKALEEMLDISLRISKYKGRNFRKVIKSKDALRKDLLRLQVPIKDLHAAFDEESVVAGQMEHLLTGAPLPSKSKYEFAMEVA